MVHTEDVYADSSQDYGSTSRNTTRRVILLSAFIFITVMARKHLTEAQRAEIRTLSFTAGLSNAQIAGRTGYESAKFDEQSEMLFQASAQVAPQRCQ